MPPAKLLLPALCTAAAWPTIATAGIMTYIQTSMGFELKPEYIVAGILLISILSVVILQREARRIFGLIDAVPQLSLDVSSIKDDVGDIRAAVKEILPWRVAVEARLAVLEDRGKR